MSRIEQIVYEDASKEVKAAYDNQIAVNGSITNMKKTLLQSLPAFDALMQWYPLRDELLKFMKPRSFVVLCYAISMQNDCLICSMYFRKEFSDLGISIKDLVFTKEEEVLEQFGRSIVKKPNAIDDEIFEELHKLYDDSQIVLLTAFGAMMIATNLINNVLEVELDEKLERYLPGGDNNE